MQTFNKLLSLQSIRRTALVCICTLAIYGCSGSSDSAPGDVSGTTDGNIFEMDATDMESLADLSVDETGSESGEPVLVDSQPSTPGVPDPVSPATTRVDFEITVPAYMSNELQVRLSWGNIDTTAAWLRDETWTLSETLPANTENRLVITFADRNGGITLGSVENTFRTGNDESQTVQISANEFNTERWDGDSDGVSNLDELIAGRNPDGDDAPQAVQAALELIPDKTFRISWQPSAGVDFYRVFENPNGVSGFQQLGNDFEPSTLFFDHRVALFKSVNTRYMVQACSAIACSDSNEVFLNGSIDPAVGYFKAPYIEPEPDGNFGSAVALSENGDTMAVSGSHEVHIYNRVDGSWLLQATLYESLILGDGGFGHVLSLSANGNTLAIGSPREPSINDGNLSAQQEYATGNAGAVYIYKRDLDSWRLQSTLRADNRQAQDLFGISVSLNGEGTILAVGAEGESSIASGINGDGTDNSLSNSGAAYVFELADGRWQQQTYLKAGNPNPGDRFGGSVSLSEDGTTLAVGARWQELPGDDTVSDGSSSGGGAVYVFIRLPTGWEEQAFLKARNPDEGNLFGFADEGDLFGFDVSLSATGDVLAVGAPQYNLGFGSTSTFPATGATYIFVRSSDTWRQRARVGTVNQGYRLGTANDLSRDGRMLAVGVPGYYDLTLQSLVSGAANIYRDDGNGWLLETTLQASNPDRGDKFGGSLSLSGDAQSLAIGASKEDSNATGLTTAPGDQNDNSAQDSGAVYLY